MEPNPEKKKKNNNPVEEYDHLISELEEMSQPQEPAQNDDIKSLKSRAQQLLVWITRHKNHVDRHELADICKEGMKTIMKIMKATGKTDAAELDFELMVLEARKIACEEAFAEDLKGFDNITPDIIESLPPKVQLSIKTRISKAKSNIYATNDTPEGILDEIGGVHDKVKENSVDDIISRTLDSNSSYALLRKQIAREDLREYIKERIDYMEYNELIQQVYTLLNSINAAYVSPTGWHLPRDCSHFISGYNSYAKRLEDLNCSESYKYQKLSIDDIFLSTWYLDTFELDIKSDFQRYELEIEEMRAIICDMETNWGKLIQELEDYYYGRKEKPSFVNQGSWDYAINQLDEIFEELYYNKRLSYSDDRYLSGHKTEVNRLIASIS